MKQLLKQINPWRKSLWFCGAGWLLAALLSVWVAPRIYHSLVIRWPAQQTAVWQEAMAQKKRALSSPWRDQRPLIIFAGDSQVEFGDWYNLFGGARAVRNCGLARAKIADVTELIHAIGDVHPQTVVLMCGINNLGVGESRTNCLRDFAALLDAAQSHLQPENILVLSVMPVRESAVDRASHQLNLTVGQFNSELSEFCRQHQVEFLNVNPAITEAAGGLASELTIDGLHLNSLGYQRLAEIITSHLAPPPHAP